MILGNKQAINSFKCGFGLIPWNGISNHFHHGLPWIPGTIYFQGIQDMKQKTQCNTEKGHLTPPKNADIIFKIPSQNCDCKMSFSLKAQAGWEKLSFGWIFGGIQ